MQQGLTNGFGLNRTMVFQRVIGFGEHGIADHDLLAQMGGDWAPRVAHQMGRVVDRGPKRPIVAVILFDYFVYCDYFE